MRQLKLQPPVRPRIRVRDLAPELGTPDVAILAWLRANGEWVKSVLSFLEQPVAEKVRAHYLPDRQDDGALPLAPDTRPAVPLQGLQAPIAPPARENNPFLGQLRAFSRRETPGRLRSTSPEQIWLL